MGNLCVLFVIIFTVNIVIGTYFVYYKYINRTYYVFNNMINIKGFDSSLLKIDKNSYKILLFTTFDTSQLKKLMIMKIFIV